MGTDQVHSSLPSKYNVSSVTHAVIQNQEQDQDEERGNGEGVILGSDVDIAAPFDGYHPDRSKQNRNKVRGKLHLQQHSNDLPVKRRVKQKAKGQVKSQCSQVLQSGGIRVRHVPSP